MYFIGAKEGPIKIGWARDPQQRLQALQVGNPAELSILGVVERAWEFEQETHIRLEPWRVRGEWFERHVALRELKELEAPFQYPEPKGLRKASRKPAPETPAEEAERDELLEEVDKAFADYEAKHGPIVPPDNHARKEPKDEH